MRSPEPGATPTLDSVGEAELLPAGWYRDPVDARLHRYWDGDQWRSASGEYPQQRGLARVEDSDPYPTKEPRRSR